MKIVVLDGYTANPGDLSWGELCALGECTIHDRTPRELVLERAQDAEILLTNKTVLDAATLGALPKVKYIGLFSTGTNVVDLAAARSRGIVVANVPAYSTPSVAQMVFAHLLNLTFHVQQHSDGVRQGRWAASKDFCYWDFPLLELEGLTMGIVGFGQIGRAVARIALAFGMTVLCHTRSVPAGNEGIDSQVRFVDLPQLLAASDVITLHAPLTEQTNHLVNRQTLAMMKPSAFLINTGRGGLVDEAALAEALNAGRLAGAGLDVLSSEPPAADNPLLTADNCCITPHIAWATGAARGRLMSQVVENLRAFLAGRRRNVVN